MKQRRLFVLLLVAVALLVLRWWRPPTEEAPSRVAEAVVRSRPAAVPPPQIPAQAGSVPRVIADNDIDALRDPFAVRKPPQPVQPAPPVVAPPVAVARPAPPPPPPPAAPPAPPPPPFQVIGTWDDGKGPSVFVSGQNRTLHARVGDVLLVEYRVLRITPQQVVLQHLPTKRDIPLTVPTRMSGP
jgi:hypothetical protein